jgi:hypothetical protein
MSDEKEPIVPSLPSSSSSQKIVNGQRKHCLIVVDVQNDFCSKGSIPITDAETVIPIINTLRAKVCFERLLLPSFLCRRLILFSLFLFLLMDRISTYYVSPCILSFCLSPSLSSIF